MVLGDKEQVQAWLQDLSVHSLDSGCDSSPKVLGKAEPIKTTLVKQILGEHCYDYQRAPSNHRMQYRGILGCCVPTKCLGSKTGKALQKISHSPEMCFIQRIKISKKLYRQARLSVNQHIVQSQGRC